LQPKKSRDPPPIKFSSQGKWESPIGKLLPVTKLIKPVTIHNGEYFHDINLPIGSLLNSDRRAAVKA
jgi:hypothetical protein